MAPLRSKTMVKGFQLLGLVLERLNGFGIKFLYFYTYRRPLPEPHLSEAKAEGSLPSGQPFEVVSRDITTPDERESGIEHHYVSCDSDGESIGHVHLLSGTIQIIEIERPVRFDGWYISDAYVDPRYRGNRLNRLNIEHGLSSAGSSRSTGGCATAFISFYNRASIYSFESMGFLKEKRTVFISLFGRKRLIELKGPSRPMVDRCPLRRLARMVVRSRGTHGR